MKNEANKIKIYHDAETISSVPFRVELNGHEVKAVTDLSMAMNISVGFKVVTLSFAVNEVEVEAI